MVLNDVQYMIVNAGPIGTELSLMGQQAKAVANVVSACY
jgi:hypothetical protein